MICLVLQALFGECCLVKGFATEPLLIPAMLASV
jgi:hypothetical protein